MFVNPLFKPSVNKRCECKCCKKGRLTLKFIAEFNRSVRASAQDQCIELELMLVEDEE